MATQPAKLGLCRAHWEREAVELRFFIDYGRVTYHHLIYDVEHYAITILYETN